MKRTTTSDGAFFTVNRTLTGTLSEAATIVMLVVAWGLILTALVCPTSLSTGPEAWLDTSLTFHDWAEFTGDLSEKYLINRLQPGASFMSEYTIRIG